MKTPRRVPRLPSNRFAATILAVAAAGMLAACSSGGGGSGGAALPKGSFIKTTDGEGFNFSLLFSTNTENRYMFLHRATDIEGSGNITALRLRLNSDEAAAITCPNTTIRVGHTSLADLSATFADNAEQGKGSLVTVIDNATVTIAAGNNGDFIEIPLSAPFHYNGVDNLVTEVTRSSACSDAATFKGLISAGYVGSLYSTSSASAITGTTSATRLAAKFVFSGGENTQNFSGASTNSWPFCGPDDAAGTEPREQLLYLASEIDGAGPITGLGFQLNAAMVSAGSYTATITMGHTTLTALTTDFAANYDSGTPVTVANNVTFSIPQGLVAGDYYWIPLPTAAFNYDGTSNLIVEVVTPQTTTPMVCAANRYASVAGSRNWGYPGDTTGSVDSTKRHARFRFNGAPMAVVEENVASYTIPFSPGGGVVVQSIYGAHVLGTGAPIQSIAFRVNADIVSDVTFTGASIHMGHTTLTDLTATLADNMDDARTVFNGNITFPAGTKAGDWITVPVSGFNYDPTKNLTIQVESGSDGGLVPLLYGGNGVISNSAGASAGSLTADGGFEGSRHPHLQLGFTK